jgi:hypothetical protein
MHAPEQSIPRRRQLVGPQIDIAEVLDKAESLVGDQPGD